MIDLINNEEQRKKYLEIFVEVYNSYVKPENRITIDEMNVDLSNKDKMERHKRAKAIVEASANKNQIIDDIQKENNIVRKDLTAVRILKTEVDVSGTEEAKKNNEFIAKYGYTSYGSFKYSQKIMEKVLYSKPKDLFPPKYDFESSIDYLEKNNDMYYAGWALVDIDKNILPEIKEYYDNSKMLIQGYGSISQLTDTMASDLYLFLPDKLFFNEDLIFNSTLIATETCKKFKETLPAGTELSKDEENYLTKGIIDISSIAMFYKEYDYLGKVINEKDSKVYQDGAINSGYFTVDGKKISGSDFTDAVKENKKIEFHEYTANEKAEISKLIDKGFYAEYQKNKDGDFVYKPVDKKVISKEIFANFKTAEYRKEFDEIIKSEKKTNYIFSRDTKQYKDMDKAVKELAKYMANANKSSKEIIEARKKLGSNFSKEFLSSEELIDKFKQTKELVDKYIEKKENDKQTGKINTNGKKRLEMAIKLSKFLDDSISVKEVVDTKDGPVERKASYSNEKVVDVNKTKINEKMLDKLQKDTGEKSKKEIITEKVKVNKQLEKEIGKTNSK